MACHKRSQFNSLVFIPAFMWNCCRLQEVKKFSRNPVQSNYVNLITELLTQNLLSQIAELARRPRIMLKILYFSGNHQFFFTGVKVSLWPGRKTCSFIGRGSIIWGRGGNFFQDIYQPEKPPWRISPGHLDRVFSEHILTINQILIIILTNFVTLLKIS